MPTPAPSTYFEFASRFATEDDCAEFLFETRWPDGFVCPACKGDEAWRLEKRRLWECTSCGRQTSLTAGTVLHGTRTDLRIWLYGLWKLASGHRSISALQFQRETGLSRYETAWTILHKVRACLAERPGARLGEGVVEVDEAMWGGKDRKRGRGLAPGGSWVYVAVERIEAQTEMRSGEVKSYRASGSARAEVRQSYSGAELLAFVQGAVRQRANVATDMLSSYSRLARSGFEHDAKKCGGNPVVIDKHLPKVHLLFSNLKTWLRGTFHGVSAKHLPAYVQEYIYLFNRRQNRGGRLLERLVGRVMNGSPVTYAALVGRRPEPSG